MSKTIELAKILETSFSLSRNGKLMIAAELRRLHAENEALKSMQADYMDAAGILHGAMVGDISMLKPLANKAAKVIAENEALRKDAVRYAWIRNNIDEYNELFDKYAGELLDSELDAAMEASK